MVIPSLLYNMHSAYMMNAQLQMITTLEWRKVCTELGVHQASRKEDMQRRIMGVMNTASGRAQVFRQGSSQIVRKVASILNIPVPRDKLEMALPAGVRLICLCTTGDSSDKQELVTCVQCGTSQHRVCIGKASNMRQYHCPQCQLQALEPLNPIVTTILPASLCTANSRISFRYTGNDRENSDFRLQLRCIQLEETGFRQRWPKDGVIVLNNKILEDMTQQQGEITKRGKENPVTVKGLHQDAENQIAVVTKRDPELYAFALFLVDTITAESLYALMSKSQMTVEAGKAFLSTHMPICDDVYTDTFCQVLRCPLTRVLPDIPVRGTRCSHVQCFDLSAYIVLQEAGKSHRWRCPICLSAAISVVVDTYIQKIVCEAKEVGAFAAEFEASGGYRLVVENEDELAEPGTAKRTRYAIRRLQWSDFAPKTLPFEELWCSSAYTRARLY